MFGGMHIETILILEDNYTFLLYDRPGGRAAVVDPGEATAVAKRLFALDLRLAHLLITHHHPDHTAGIAELLQLGTRPEVIAAEPERSRLPWVTRSLHDGDRATVVGEDLECLFVPGHTRGSAAFHFPEAGTVFTGDTLFLGGCGRIMEGTAAQLHDSLAKLAALRPTTQVFCGHEYTDRNLTFARTVEPDNSRLLERLDRVRERRSRRLPTMPGRIEEELATNPFLRCHDVALQRVLGADDELSAFAELRRRKDRF